MSLAKMFCRALLGTVVWIVLAGSGLAQKPPTSKPVAEVNGTVITASELEAVLRQAGPSTTPLSDMQKRQMQMHALGMLIDDILMQQCMSKYGPKIEQADVDKRFADLQDSLKKDGKTIHAFYQETNQTEAQVRSHITTGLQWAAHVQQNLTDADVKKYYEDSKDFWDRTSVRASHIVIRVGENAKPEERQAAIAKLQELRKDLLAGKIDFAEAAKKHSHCSTAPTGGDIGYFSRKLMVEEAFARTAYATKVGEISDVVQTDYGVHLIKVTDRKPGKPSDFTKIQEEVRELCTEEMRLNMLNQERKTAKVVIHLPDDK